MKRPSTIPTEMSLQGDIEGDGDLVLFGRVEGDVRVGGALLVEEGGAVKGDVHAQTVTIRGAVLGDAYGTELVRVDEGGSVVGDVTAPRVKMAEGARFRGRMHMDESAALPAGYRDVRAETDLRTSPGEAPAAEPSGDADSVRRQMDVEAAASQPETGTPSVPSEPEPAPQRESTLAASESARRRAPAPRMPKLHRRTGHRRIHADSR